MYLHACVLCCIAGMLESWKFFTEAEKTKKKKKKSKCKVKHYQDAGLCFRQHVTTQPARLEFTTSNSECVSVGVLTRVHVCVFACSC